jgi:hypothetical protein
LLDFNAALDVQFDVVEAVEQEQLIPEATLTEEEEEDLSYPIKDARARDGGAADIKTRLKQLFDDITRLETQLSKDKEDRETQDGLARARTIYEFSKRYAADTASKQEGAVAEEEQATGSYVKAEVEIGADEAAALEKEIADQRAAEQAAIQAAVDAAAAEIAEAQAAQEESARKEAEAAAAAKAAEDEVARLQALIAAYEEEQAQQAGSRRRMLEGEEATPSIEEIRAQLETANGAAEAAKAEADAAAAEA